MSEFSIQSMTGGRFHLLINRLHLENSEHAQKPRGAATAATFHQPMAGGF
ncbi:hypothetical protein HYU22_00880 [Candidatus Woesearchaeota archaeon]|nr:hypothetical protein [Candidatus Woesearchaeota archaeon]